MEAWRSPDSGFWNELSARDRYRKMHPALSAHSGMQFPFASHWESAPHSEVEFWDEFSAGATLGKVHPTLESKSGTQFPRAVPLGKYVPLWARIPGCTFRLEPIRKRHPVLEPNSGKHFPPRVAKGSASHSEHQFWDEVSSSNRLSKERVHSAILQNRLSRTASPTGPSRHRKRTYIRIYSCNLIE